MSSYLIHHENGRIALNSFAPCTNAVSVSFKLESSDVTSAELFIFARPVAESFGSLTLTVGTTEYSIAPSPTHYKGGEWLRCSLDAGSLSSGENTVTIHPQAEWAVAIETASNVPVIRLRVTNGHAENERVLPSYGDSAIEQNREEWLALLPPELRESSVATDAGRWDWCWKVAGFVSSAWKYSNCFDGTSYAPWDTRTILAWGRAECDDRGERAIAMCVHYAIVFVQFCIARGIPARAVVLTPDLKNMSGHFVAEVWLDELQAWAMVDANMHLAYIEKDSGRPLAVAELGRGSNEIRDLAQFGPGWESHRQRFEEIVSADYLSGNVYCHWGVWRRHNWIEGPDLAPLAHGAFAYCETDIIWCAEDEESKAELGMFPYFLTAAELARPPYEERISSDN